MNAHDAQEQATLEPITPGEILLEEFMKPLGLSQSRLARDLDMPQSRLSAIIAGKRAITADTALRLATCFGTTPHFWLNLQAEYDLRKARRKSGKDIRERVRRIVTESD